MKRLLFLCVALIALAMVAMTGLGHWFDDPARALAVNPFNGDARVRLVEQAVASPDTADWERSATVARDGIRFAPIDARLYSLLGEVGRHSGDADGPQRLYETALSLSGTENLALQRTLQVALRNRDFSDAMDRLDILFRRWPAAFDSFAPAIPYVLSDPDGFEIALDALRREPPWRRHFLDALYRSPQTLDMAFRLQQALNGDGGNPEEAARAQRALMRNGDYLRAFRLFVMTQSPEDRQNYGNIFNGRFDLEPSARPFDWQVRSSSGVSITRRARDADGERSHRLQARFLDKPVKGVGLSQMLILPPGEYRLTADVGASDLKLPKGLYFDLSCADPRYRVARLDVPAGSYRGETLETDFTLPDRKCRILRLSMKTDLLVESFRYGYSGTLSINAVAIDRRP